MLRVSLHLGRLSICVSVSVSVSVSVRVFRSRPVNSKCSHLQSSYLGMRFRPETSAPSDASCDTPGKKRYQPRILPRYKITSDDILPVRLHAKAPNCCTDSW